MTGQPGDIVNSTSRMLPTRRLVASVALLWGAAALAGCEKASVEKVETTAAVPVYVEEARIDMLQSVVTAAGTVMPAPGAELTVVAPSPARIAELPKAEGDTVREGDLLVRFDIPSLSSDVAARKAQVAQATARLEAAKASYARLSGLVTQGVAAPREVEEVKRLQAEAEADLEQAKRGVESAVSLSDRAVVRARFAGVVSKRFHNPGDLVDASATDPVLKVINPASLQVVAQSVSERRISERVATEGADLDVAHHRCSRASASQRRGSSAPSP